MLWARIEDDYWGYDVLRARRALPLGILPPITFAQTRKFSNPAYQFESDRAWAIAYSKMLASSPHCPLSDGEWHLGHFGLSYSARELSQSQVQEIVGQASRGYIQWDFGCDVYPITLRDMSPPESGRVKAWRKLVKDGSLPPILLYWVSGLSAYVVIDGHDRLLAAALEKAPIGALSIELVTDYVCDEATRDAILRQVELALAGAKRERSRPVNERLARARRLMTVGRANELLLDAFSPNVVSRPTKALALRGGWEIWATEVRNELALQKADSQGLLDGLDGDEAGLPK